ncbi:hypothetical protein MRX96_000083 [Rhipicephalus microplus]
MKTRQHSSTLARKPQNDSLTAKMLQLESTIKLMQEFMRHQQESIRKQAEMNMRLTSQQPRLGMQWNVSAPPTATLTLSDATAMPPLPLPPPQGTDKTSRRKKARRSSVNESDEEEHLNMDNDADETTSVSSISTQLSRTTEGQEGLKCGARFKKICNRLNSRTWKLLRPLRDDTQSKSYQQHRLAQILHAAIKEHGEDEVGRRLNDQYLPTSAQTRHPDYAGPGNPPLDVDIEEVGLRPPRDEAPKRTEIGRDIARHFVVLPLPRNIHPQRNEERRVARARVLAETHASDSTAVYVDAAKHQYRPHTYVAVVV